MPAWLEKIEGGMRRGGVDNPYALLNSMKIKRGSKTVVDEDEAKRKMSAYGRRRKRRGVSAHDAGNAMARDGERKHSRRSKAAEGED